MKLSRTLLRCYLMKRLIDPIKPATRCTEPRMAELRGVQSHENIVDSGYQAHALVGTIAKIYALHNGG